jgi:hypothetical protein
VQRKWNVYYLNRLHLTAMMASDKDPYLAFDKREE